MIAPWKRLVTSALLTAFAAVSSGYYHYIQYDRDGAPLVRKFDLAAIPNKTVPVYVSQQQGALQLAPGDTFAALVSQIKAAVKVWNDVESSDLRLSFGGLNNGDPGTSGPSIEISIGEVPPGLVAMGTPVAGDSNGKFVPIKNSVVIIGADLHDKPSYSEALAGTLVHELGHALGLQHTFTSSTMSTGITRATSKSHPLGADEIAGISTLYPTSHFLAKTGTITGHVTVGKSGENLASVVALSSDGPAVSAMTNPDGTYEIDGLPPGKYVVYAHPLPPPLQGETTPGNVSFPQDADGNFIAPTGYFDTLFYPGTRDPKQAANVEVTASKTQADVDFSVHARPSVGLHSIQTYTYPGGSPVKPAYLNPTMQYPLVVASGTGITNSKGLVSGLSVAVLGGGSLSLRNFPGYPTYIVMDVDPTTLGKAAVRHLVFSLNDEVYVLPVGYLQAVDAPPSIATATSDIDSNKNKITLVAGTNLHADSTILFDGAAGTVQSVDDSGRLLVKAPASTSGYVANVVALNSDGQSSLFMQANNVPTFTYDAPDSSSVKLALNSLPAGATSVIDIDGKDAHFVDGQTSVGFGSTDVTVQQLWVVNENKLRVNVTVAPGANQEQLQPTIVSGLQTISPDPFNVTSANPKVLSLDPRVLDVVSGQTYVYPGGTAAVNIFGPPVEIASLNLSVTSSLTLDDNALQIASINGNQIIFQVPSNVKTGTTALLRLDSGDVHGNPIAIYVDVPPPQIGAVAVAPAAATDQAPVSPQPVDAKHPAHIGDTLALQVAGLGDPKATVSTSRVSVNIGGVDVTPSAITSSDSGFQVTVTVPSGAQTGSQVPVTIALDGHSSPSFSIPIQAQ